MYKSANRHSRELSRQGQSFEIEKKFCYLGNTTEARGMQVTALKLESGVDRVSSEI